MRLVVGWLFTNLKQKMCGLTTLVIQQSALIKKLPKIITFYTIFGVMNLPLSNF